MTKIFISQLNYSSDPQHNYNQILNAYEQSVTASANLALFSRFAISGFVTGSEPLQDNLIKLCQECLKDLTLFTSGKKTAAIIGSIETDENNALVETIYLISNGLYRRIMSVPLIARNDSIEPCYVQLLNLRCALLFEENGQIIGNSASAQQEHGKPRCADVTIVLGKSLSQYVLTQDIIPTQDDGKLFYVNLLGGYDSKIFSGGSFAYHRQKVFQLKRWEEDSQLIEENFSPHQTREASPTEFLYQTLLLSLRDYVRKNNFPGVILGMSGGIDSALVSILAADALGAENVHTLMLPTRYTSRASVNDARVCANAIGTKHSIMEIEEIFCTCISNLKSLSIDSTKNSTEENIQSRIRGMILMAVSNSLGLMLLATGNKSEILTGYMTMYGDTCGGFAPIKSVYKTEVYELVDWRNKNIPEQSLCKRLNVIPREILEKAPSAELRPNQTDQDTLPEYSTLDNILRLLIDQRLAKEEVANLGYRKNDIAKVEQLFKKAKFKLSQLAIGPDL